MKIVFLTNYPDISVGGDSRVPWELARSFAEYTDNEVWIIKAGKEFKLERDHISKKLMTFSFPADEIDLKFYFFKTSLRNISRVFKFLDEIQPDIIHGHSFDPTCYICQSWALKEKVPFVYTSHVLPSQSTSFIPDIRYIRIISALVNIPYETYTRSFYSGCASIITLNESAKKDFQGYMKNKKMRYDTIPNGTYLEKAYFLERKPPKERETLRIIFPGHLSSRKNQNYIIESLKYIRSDRKIELFLPGSQIDKQYLKLLNKTSNELEKIKPNIKVILPGHMDHELLLNKYKESHFLISSSKMEVQSLVIIEALASGLPILALENETTTELIKSDRNGYLTRINTSPKDFALLIDKLLTIESAKYTSFSEEAIKSVNHLSWRNTVTKTEEIYKDIVKNYKHHVTESGLERIMSKLRIEDGAKDDNDPLVQDKKNRMVTLSVLAGIALSALTIFNLATSINRSTKKIKSAVKERRNNRP